MKKFKIYAAYIIGTVLVGVIAAFLINGNMEAYSKLAKPELSPPAWLFPVVWTVLYVLMGIGAARYNLIKGSPLTIYFSQLFVNFLWPIVFFNFESYLLAFVLLVLLMVLVIRMSLWFYDTDKLSGILQIPYVLWLIFAGYLNFMVYFLN